MTSAKVYDMSNVSENVGLYIEVGSDSENDDWEREQIEKEDEEIRDFVKCHPLPSIDYEGDNPFWFKAIHRMKDVGKVDAIAIFALADFETIKRMYENITDKKVIIECGKKLNSKGERDAMIINLTLLSFAMVELDSVDVERDNADKLITTQMRVIEHWWDGIGTWKA